MRISIYTFVKDGLYLDFHVVEMLKHHARLADEIVVNEGYSVDGTYEAIKDIDPKIRIERTHWDRSDPKTWSIKYRNAARKMCTGDWCIMLDADEFIPEWEFDRLRQELASTTKTILPLRYVNFYGSFNVYNSAPQKYGWPESKFTVHRNVPEIEAWGDGANVRHSNYRNADDSDLYGAPILTVHHFGMVRNPARLRQKWRHQSLRNRHGSTKRPAWDPIPSFFYDLFPHKWDDPEFLADLMPYDGPFIRPVVDNPSEFVRDGLQMYHALCGRK